jgi:hypothetical protein
VRISWVVGGLLVVTLTACSQTSNAPQSSGSASSASGSGGSSASPTPKPTPTRTATPPTRAALPSQCSLLLPNSVIDKALGRRLGGKTVYIKGLAEPKIGRTGRATCRYGVHNKAVPIEVGVSGYRTVAEANSRVQVTVTAERDAGASSQSTTVGGHHATVLLGKHGSLLVYGSVNRTVAVTLGAGVAGRSAAKVLETLAASVDANLP